MVLLWSTGGCFYQLPPDLELITMRPFLLCRRFFGAFRQKSGNLRRQRLMPRHFICQQYAVMRRFQQNSFVAQVHNRKATNQLCYADLEKLHATKTKKTKTLMVKLISAILEEFDQSFFDRFRSFVYR